MTTAVLIPWSSTCPHRVAALDWVLSKYDALGWPVFLGSCEGEFSRTQAILDAHRPGFDAYVVTDGDVWSDPREAVAHVHDHGWAIPHRRIHRLSADSTTKVLAGADWHGLPLSTDNRQDSRPYVGHPAGTMLVLTAEAFDTAPPEPRFVGWGQEDDAWAAALNTLVGRPWRGTDDLVHLWHPAEPRLSRRVGNAANDALWRRYRDAHGRPTAMRALLDETRVAV